jgi:5'(3')-deoxyribonucleotidase
MDKLPRIYVDMDGVLCDFKSAAIKTTGMSIDKWMKNNSELDKWKPIIDKKDFWYNLPWQPGGQQLWSYINNYQPHILSAYVEHASDPNCIPGKRSWAISHLGIPANRINLVKRKEKQNYAKVDGEPALLIDDYIKNINQFKARGGIGILHTSAANTISQLKKLGFK